MALEPITRAEQIMSGESLEPITREEMFLAKAAGMDVDTPEPITRREMFLSKISGGGGGGSGGSGSEEEWFNDGNTHIWITLREGRTSPMLGVCPNGTVTVDWGDGTEPDVLTGTSTSTVKWTPKHEYASPGEYVIRLVVDGEMWLAGSSSMYNCAYIMRDVSGWSRQNQVYQNAVQKIEIGNGVTSVGSRAFYSCRSLASVAISNSVTSIGGGAFYECYSLLSVTIPNSVTSIGSGAFYKCSISSIAIPGGVPNIAASMFYGCDGMRFFDFSKHTKVPELHSSDAFYDIATDCEIRVPAALYDEWIAATNWSTYASKIVAV